MNRTFQIAILLLSSIGIYTRLHHRQTCSSSKCTPNTSKEVEEMEDKNPKNTLSSLLQKYPTKQGIIEVATHTASKKEKHRSDVQKYATRQGVIEIADNTTLKKKQKTLSQIGKQGEAFTQTHHPLIHPKTAPTSNYFKWLIKEFDKNQVTITNTSNQTQTVTLWGRNIPPETVTSTEISDHEVQQTVLVSGGKTHVGEHPQGVAYNPVNGLIYVANQLSNNVTVLTSQGTIVTTISLEPHYSNSPVDLAIHTTAGAHYGHVYVVGIIANTVTVIDRNHTIVDTIVVGKRPVSIAYHAVNNRFYVANLIDDTVSVIDGTTHNVTTLTVGQRPLDIATSNNGFIYVANSGDDTVSIIDTQDQVSTITHLTGKPVALAYQEHTHALYVVAEETNVVYVIAPNLQLVATISVGNAPRNILYNPHNQHMYVGNRADNTYTIIAPDRSTTTLSLGTVNIGLSSSSTENRLFSTAPHANTLQMIGFAQIPNPVTYDEDYRNKAHEFQHAPALVKHVKFVFSGTTHSPVLKRIEKRITGKNKASYVSFGNYKSPQNFLNVCEVFELDGAIIDGSNSWSFTIAPHQTITTMVYYKQLKMYQRIPQL